jgi:hypothetical protein
MRGSTNFVSWRIGRSSLTGTVGAATTVDETLVDVLDVVDVIISSGFSTGTKSSWCPGLDNPPSPLSIPSKTYIIPKGSKMTPTATRQNTITREQLRIPLDRDRRIIE